MKGGDNMFEKYAVDPSLIPPTDDQLRTLKEKLGTDFAIPKTAQEAEELICEVKEEE